MPPIQLPHGARVRVLNDSGLDPFWSAGTVTVRRVLLPNADLLLRRSEGDLVKALLPSGGI